LVAVVVFIAVLTTGAVIDDSSLLGAGRANPSSSSLESRNLELPKVGLSLPLCSILPFLNREKKPLLLETPASSSLLELSLLLNLVDSVPVVLDCLGDRRVLAKVVSLLGFLRLKLESEGILSRRGRDMSPLAMSMEGETVVVVAVDTAVGVCRRDMRIGLRSVDGVGGSRREDFLGGGTEEGRVAEGPEMGTVVVREGIVVAATAAGRELCSVLAVVGLGGWMDEVRRVLGRPFCFCWRGGDFASEDVKGVERGIVVPGGLDGWTSCTGDCVVTNVGETTFGIVVVDCVASDGILGTA
jgi:hypothetical protein